jgi:RimJ/RimL family protein N-acetyltransferase
MGPFCFLLRFLSDILPMQTVATLHTPRLTLRPFGAGDRPAMIALQGDPQVMRYYGNGEALSPAQVELVLDAHIHCRDKYYWAWAASLNDDPACFGQITAMPVEWNSHPWIELCWLLMPGRWRRGYATEGVRAVMQHGVKDLGWRNMMASADIRNLPSLRVMIKNNMTFARDEKDERGRTRRIYTLTTEPVA